MMTQRYSYQRQHYRPSQQEQWLQRQASELARRQAEVQAEEQSLPRLRAQWFPAQVKARNQRYAQEMARIRKESQQRQSAARLHNAFYILSGKGRPRSTPHQEELFLVQTRERLRQQMLKEEETDQSRMAYQERMIRQKRATLAADQIWLASEYQRHLQFAQTQEQRDWLLTLSQWYPALLSAQQPVQGQPPTTFVP
jgi:hypothetical protein